ncbi:urea-proton symporter DUR3 [Aplysia californica]|uniref:Urea-proton symporter DUR3 n=1 Tax=Aplysia californica TaxID=6500 RepID=A0ABM1VXY8_APLCA|nr:urea-proton symporter DUR3 [Aplysia californica]
MASVKECGTVAGVNPRRFLLPLLLLMVGLFASATAQNTSQRSCPLTLKPPTTNIGVKPVLSTDETALLMILGFGGFSIILALVHNNIRKYVFHDEHNLDTTFDAGGNVSMSLTAVTVASQLFWPGDILHSATLTTKNGIAGPFWYAVGIMFNIFVFPILSVQFKTKAPGAKTYLQIIKARFGKRAHTIFCMFAILTNLVITIGVLLAGKATIQVRLIFHSFLTFRSWGAFLFGIIEIFVSSAVTYCDQASWQSRIAAKPVQGVWGFILAGFIWFSIPNVMATTTGMAYLALSSDNGTHLLSENQILEGQRNNLEPHHCVLCGKTRKGLAKSTTNAHGDHTSELCSCANATNCTQCTEDVARARDSTQYYLKQPYSCTTHGRFRDYMDFLFDFKNWCIVWVTLSMIPLGLIVFKSGINLNWIFYSGATVTIPCFPPVVLSIVWVKATGTGLIAGSLSGLVSGVVATMVAATQYPGGLNLFLDNTVRDYTILAGNGIGFLVSLTVCIVGSLLTHKIKSPADEEFEWMKMYDIDNPLQPWELLYREDMKGMEYEERPSFAQMEQAFRKAKLTAYIAGSASIFLFAFLIPGIMAAFPDMNLTRFGMWLNFTQTWAVVMAIIVVVLPPTEEIIRIVRQCRKNKTPSQGTLKNGCTMGGNQFNIVRSPSAPEAYELVVKDSTDVIGANSDVLPTAV